MISDVVVELDLTGPVVEWRGPAPHHFLEVTGDHADQVREVARQVTYGWGMVPVRVRVGGTTSTTALWARDGGYVVPLKVALRRAEGIDLGDVVSAHVQVLRQG
ncbi:DUF1905 domain-containing protein [Klenkia brasiliensis]|uniref:DUF1905 domain-containing protein n=1 Tax=Klenkia brasiliensis TaxID=333142 RepID=A0A1G7LVP2_9ACTN|nr:DUF1905 domain-containing protein [Klenkia brasiliensis]SDF53648.1 protein of unknown function [Klenkia brasiliensis]